MIGLSHLDVLKTSILLINMIIKIKMELSTL
nr:MAG TPA: hypothetical protein [Caudoviricetes sp.]